TINSFGIASLHERCEFIRQLGIIFLVRPEILKSYITENYLARIDSTLLKPYLAQRSDWVYVEKEFNDAVGITGDDGAVNENSIGLRDRLGMGKLSAMMKELEGLK